MLKPQPMDLSLFKKLSRIKWNKDFKCGTLKVSAKKLENGIDINNLSPADLHLSTVDIGRWMVNI